MRILFFFVFVVSFWAADAMSIPMSAIVSSASFSSLSNANLTTSFFDCGNSNYKLYDITLHAKSAVTIDVCNASNSVGGCVIAGDTSSATATTYATGDKIILGYSNGSITPSEMTTGTKISGDVVAYRRCGLIYYQKDF